MTAEQRKSIEEDIRIARAFADDEEAQGDMRKWQAALALIDAQAAELALLRRAVYAWQNYAYREWCQKYGGKT